MHAYFADQFVLPLPNGHRFPMHKYRLLREALECQLPAVQLHEATAATPGELALVHTPAYVNAVLDGTLSATEQRDIGFPWSPAMAERACRSVGGTVAACRHAMQGGGVAANLAGGTHHAYAGHGEGYCVFNDSAVAARAMQAEGRVHRVVIIDCDVHQGNGTAAILAGDPTCYTFSIHGAKNFPFHKETSDHDIALEDGAGDAEYLAALDAGLCQALEESHADLAIYLAGSDPFEDDKLGRLKLSKAGLAARDRMVLEYCRGAGLPVAITMAGGYARNVADTVDIHFETVRLAALAAG